MMRENHLDLAQDKIELIEKIIKNDRKFENNEDLFDDFVNETCKRSLSVIKTISSEDTLEIYLRKVAATSIINVLKNSGRLRRTRQGFIPAKEVSLDAVSEVFKPIDYSDINIEYKQFKIQETPEDVVIKKEILQKVIEYVYSIHNSDTSKKYLEIYLLRYEQGYTQKEIARELNLSQSEVSKRLFKLMDRIKMAFN